MKSVILYSILALLNLAAAVWLIFIPESNLALIARALVWSGLLGCLGVLVDALRERRERAARERSAARAAAWQMVRERIHRAAELDPATLTREIK